jgi:hypothetical protein
MNGAERDEEGKKCVAGLQAATNKPTAIEEKSVVKKPSHEGKTKNGEPARNAQCARDYIRRVLPLLGGLEQ